MKGGRESAGDRARASVPQVGPLLGRFRLAARPEREGVPVAAWDSEARRAVSVAGLGRPLTEPERRRLAKARRVVHPALAAPLAEGPTVLGPVVVTELVTGRTLADGLVEEPMAQDAVRSLLAPVAAALDALHAAGLAHGALALDQVWVTEEGAAVLWGAEVPRGGTEAPTPAADVLAFGRIVARCLRGTSADGARGAPPLPASVTAALAPDPASRPDRARAVLEGFASPSSSEEASAPAEPAADAAEPPARGRTRGSWRLVASLALLGLVVLVAALLLGGRDDGPTTPRPVSVRAGQVALGARAPWRRASSAAGARELGLRDAVALVRPGALLVTGRVVRPDPVTLLPRGLPTSGRGRAVRLGGRAARRWTAPRLPGTAFLVPAVRGRPLLVACRATRLVLLSACERIATRATLPASGPLDPDPHLAAVLAGVGRNVAAAAKQSRERLARARRPRGRAAVVARLAAAYARAARGFRRAPATPAARAALRALARATAGIVRADRRFARALAHPRRPGTKAALRAAFRALRAADRPAGVLAALGYRPGPTRRGSSSLRR